MPTGDGYVAVVNETFARTFWPGVNDPIGKRFKNPGNPKAPWITVVGLAADVKHYGLERPMRPGIYFPVTVGRFNTMTVAIRTSADPGAFTATARATLRELDPELPMYRVRTMEEALRRSMAQRATYSWLLGIFAGMALVLALGGSYGVTSYLVSQRTREIGIRVALGARSADIVRAVLRRGLINVGAGRRHRRGGVVRASSGCSPTCSSACHRTIRHPWRGDDARCSSCSPSPRTGCPRARAARVDPMRSLRTN